MNIKYILLSIFKYLTFVALPLYTHFTEGYMLFIAVLLVVLSLVEVMVYLYSSKNMKYVQEYLTYNKTMFIGKKIPHIILLCLLFFVNPTGYFFETFKTLLCVYLIGVVGLEILVINNYNKYVNRIGG